MTIFPLDRIRNAVIDREVEPLLEDVREAVHSFAFTQRAELGNVEDILAAYDMARPRLNVLVSLLRSLAGHTGADISTGLGFLPVLLARYGVHTIATERDVGISEFATGHGVEVRPYTLGKSAPPFTRESLDFLVFAEVLEHLKLSPIHVLRELHSLLRPDGRMILTTPNIARLEHIEALLAGENFLEPFPESLASDADPTDYVEHVREYSIREVVDLVEGAGFAVEQVLMTGWGEAGYDALPNPWLNEICVAVVSR
jgi:2-polyprenyl-3-methyl-5-hydroxy-6-metoxy-1,4-benzoquinol methylase